MESQHERSAQIRCNGFWCRYTPTFNFEFPWINAIIEKSARCDLRNSGIVFFLRNITIAVKKCSHYEPLDKLNKSTFSLKWCFSELVIAPTHSAQNIIGQNATTHKHLFEIGMFGIFWLRKKWEFFGKITNNYLLLFWHIFVGITTRSRQKNENWTQNIDSTRNVLGTSMNWNYVFSNLFISALMEFLLIVFRVNFYDN